MKKQISKIRPFDPDYNHVGILSRGDGSLLESRRGKKLNIKNVVSYTVITLISVSIVVLILMFRDVPWNQVEKEILRHGQKIKKAVSWNSWVNK